MEFNFTDVSNIGKEYKNFVLLSIDDLPDYKTKAVYLRHKTTGLEVYHILAEDKENLFAFAFRTFAKNSKGVAHIMEHSVLCGSEKYHLKEPFGTLCGTSINTFLNAMTYPDKTVYPGASLIRKDYFTMMDVYADAVFFPLLDHATFLQEGHRLELDEKEKLSIQGVVYNEMKGNYSSFPQVAFSKLINTMFPESFPSFDSGGDPLDIPTLTYEEFLDFHQKFYAPDNCLLYLYGNIPTADQLDFLNERFIERLEKKYNCTKVLENAYSNLPVIKPEIMELQQIKCNTESKTVYEIAPESGATGNLVTLNYYTGQCDMEKYYLSEVISGNDSSPLSKALKDSGYGDEDQSSNFGQFQEEFYSIGMLNVKKGDEEKLFKVIQKALQNIYDNGISQEDIDSAIMGIDFNLREVNRYWGPISLTIMEKVLKGWNYGLPCSNQLTPITSFELIKQKVREDKDYTRNLIKKYFLDAKIQIKFICEPSKKYFEQRNKVEKELITKLEKSLDKAQLKKDLDELHKYQSKIETSEETACIPTTKINELDSKIEIKDCDLQFVEGADNSKVPLFVCKENTNGIFYINILFPFDRLEPKYYQYLPFLSNTITNLGWNGKKWDKCTQEMACVMGDINGKLLCGTVSNAPECQEVIEKYKDYNFIKRNWLGINCKALTSQAEETLKMLSEIITTMDFDDKKHFNVLIGELQSEKKATFVQCGRDFAIKRACCMNHPHQALLEILYGLSQYETCMEYNKRKSKKILETFKYIYEECRKAGGIIQITADDESLVKIIPMLEDFAKASKITKLLPGVEHKIEDYVPFIRQREAAVGEKCNQVLKVPTQTGYAVGVTKCSEYLTQEASAEYVFNLWFNNHTLWDKIRTIGGAYGASSWSDNISGCYVLSSYRDPNPVKSVDVFREGLKSVVENPISKDDVEKSVVSCYGDFIYPLSPKDRGNQSFESLLYASPTYLRQKRVDMLLAVKEDDVKKAVEKLYKNTEEIYRTAVFCDNSIECCGNNLKISL